MDFSMPERLKDLLPEVRQFVDDELIPIESGLLEGGFRAMLPELDRVRERVKANGWWTPQMSAHLGGMGLSLVEHGLLTAELGRTPIGHYCFNCQAPDAGNMELLHLHGSDAQVERYLKPLVRGEIRSCFGMTEPEHAGSNPVWMSTTAVKDGNDYVINGHKWFASSAEGAAFAIVMAVTDPTAAPHFRASMILVPTNTPGYQFVRNIPIMGDVGEDWASHAELRFDNCRVPQSNLLGPEGAGFMLAQERLGPGRIHHCMRWLGMCERSFELMCDYAAKREIAPGKPLGSRQFIQGWIAESRAEINAARLAVLHAAWMIEKLGPKEAREEISLIKFHVAGVLQRVVDRAIQVHGGLGVTDYTPLSYFFRHERAARIYDGADEVHKLSVAKRILKQYGIAVESGARQ